MLAVYRPSVIHQLMSLVFLIPVGIVGWLFIMTGEIKIETDDFSAFMCVIVVLVTGFSAEIMHEFLVITRNKLIIREDGLEWWYARQHGFVAWDKLQKWDRKRFRWQNRTYFGFYAYDNQFIPVDHYLYLPVFVLPTVIKAHKLQRLRDTEAGSLIFYYAPHLFKNLPDKKKR